MFESFFGKKPSVAEAMNRVHEHDRQVLQEIHDRKAAAAFEKKRQQQKGTLNTEIEKDEDNIFLKTPDKKEVKKSTNFIFETDESNVFMKAPTAEGMIAYEKPDLSDPETFRQIKEAKKKWIEAKDHRFNMPQNNNEGVIGSGGLSNQQIKDQERIGEVRAKIKNLEK